jgi:RNA polymerase sigma-70 factor (ECF subfamily)
MSDNAQLVSFIEAIAVKRDASAFDALYRRFAPRVTAYLLKRKADPSTAAEVTQEVMLTVWKRAGSYEAARASVATWIYTIARNRFIDRIRREKRPEIDPDDPALVQRDRAPDSVVNVRREGGRLREALASLPPEQGDLIRMAYLEGKSHGDIAAEQSLPLGTVKSRFRLALAKLRNHLSEGSA